MSQTLEDRIKALVVRMAKAKSSAPRLVFTPEGVYRTKNGKTVLLTWDEWDAGR